MKTKKISKRKKIKLYKIIIFLLLLAICLFVFIHLSKTSETSVYSEIHINGKYDENHSKFENVNNQKDYVVLMHGIASGSWYMSKIATRLVEEGYTVINIDYPSRSVSIENLSNLIYNEIILQINADTKLYSKENKKYQIHFVGHSMGAFLIRALLNSYEFENIGKVIQLAPPNKGSEISDFFSDFSFFEALYGPAAKELSTKEVEKFSDSVDYELGIIAGSRTLAPFSSFFLLEGADDGRVRIENTKILGMKEHIVLPVSHTYMGFDDEVIENIISFIQTASFKIEG